MANEAHIDIDAWFDALPVVAVTETVEYVAAPTERELIAEAGRLNNSPALVGTDHVSIMGMMDRAEMVRHVAKLRALAA